MKSAGVIRLLWYSRGLNSLTGQWKPVGKIRFRLLGKTGVSEWWSAGMKSAGVIRLLWYSRGLNSLTGTLENR
jgi:hypothetical protein